MLQTRVIPCLLLRSESIVKTIRFKNYGYIGDPINTVRIFNELEVDELIFLDITSTLERRSPNLKILREIADECFMPLAYGGGIRNFEDAKKIFSIGFEKLAINSFACENPGFITKLTEHFGNQAIIGSIDVKKNIFGNYHVYSNSGKKNTKKDPVEWAMQMESLGVGEILITSIDREGTWAGFDNSLVKKITSSVNVPVIANGGGGTLLHIESVIKEANASAVALGSMVVYQKKDLGVLINFPDKEELATLIK